MTKSTEEGKGFVIRPARPSDVPKLATLGAHVFATTYAHTVTPLQLKAYLSATYSDEKVEMWMQDTETNVIVAASKSDDTAILGFTVLTRNTSKPCLSDVPRLCELQKIYVDPTLHGRGIGKALAGHLDDLAREEGFENVWLSVYVENMKAQAVYKRLGYRIAGEDVFEVGGVAQTDYIMVKALR